MADSNSVNSTTTTGPFGDKPSPPGALSSFSRKRMAIWKITNAILPISTHSDPSSRLRL